MVIGELYESDEIAQDAGSMAWREEICGAIWRAGHSLAFSVGWC